RYATLPNMMKAASYEPEGWTSQSLDFDPAQLGLKGSPTSVVRIFAPPARTGGDKIDGTTDPQGAAATVVQKIFEQNIIQVSPGAKGGRR
ncbi:MAG: electron transfer flavoprotein subunit beta, partial [Peptococcaceae bacterium]|nr:electron transfer flavoprotein subunit beta [Peptococcaceae bacterium]